MCGSFIVFRLSLLFSAVGCCSLYVSYVYVILYWESQAGRVCFTSPERVSLSQINLFCLFSFTRQFVSLIAQVWPCVVFCLLAFHFLVRLGVVVWFSIYMLSFIGRVKWDRFVLPLQTGFPCLKMTSPCHFPLLGRACP